jgi:hypothetical protein
MKFASRLAVAVTAVIVCGHGIAAVAHAKDVFLTIGGGPDPTGNQVSLEKNVIYLQSVLAEKRPDRPRHEIYFADGNDEERDVHFRDPDFEKNAPPARRMMAELFGDPQAMDYVYRNHEIAGLTGPAEKGLIEARFRALANELQSGDRLLVYATGHGGEARSGRGGRGRRGGGRGRGNPYNTTLYLWNDERLSANEFAGWLSDLRPDVSVVLVMVQCHAGGFAHTIFEQASANGGLAPHARCGFFSQVHDRAAAGCTPDVDEADYQEYSSFFWAALAGRTRAGAELPGVDYDKDGVVSFAEAHAYAVLASDTIDIPIRTSGALLRQYSRVDGATTAPASAAPVTTGRRGLRGRRGRGAVVVEQPAEAAEPPQQPAPAQRVEGLLALSGPIAKLIELARPDERAILEQLPARLGLGNGATVEDVRRRLEQADGEIAAADDKLSEAAGLYDAALGRVRGEVRRIWPELHSDYSPLAMALASERAEEFAGRVSALESYQALRFASREQQRATDARLDAERTEAKVQRLLRTCEDVVLAANLPKLVTPEVVRRYEQILALEGGTLAAKE